MARQLSPKEEKHYQELDSNFSQKVQEYKQKKEKELSEGKKEELILELKKLEEYYEGCQNSMISDLEVNIRFCGAKIEVLKKILE